MPFFGFFPSFLSAPIGVRQTGQVLLPVSILRAPCRHKEQNMWPVIISIVIDLKSGIKTYHNELPPSPQVDPSKSHTV